MKLLLLDHLQTRIIGRQPTKLLPPIQEMEFTANSASYSLDDNYLYACDVRVGYRIQAPYEADQQIREEAAYGIMLEIYGPVWFEIQKAIRELSREGVRSNFKGVQRLDDICKTLAPNTTGIRW